MLLSKRATQRETKRQHALRLFPFKAANDFLERATRQHLLPFMLPFRPKNKGQHGTFLSKKNLLPFIPLPDTRVRWPSNGNEERNERVSDFFVFPFFDVAHSEIFKERERRMELTEANDKTGVEQIAPRAWWSALPDPLTVTQLDHAIRRALTTSGWYRSDVGGCVEPTSADLPMLFEVVRNLEDRIDQGERFVADHPLVAPAVRKLALLRRDHEATFTTFERALSRYEAEQDALVLAVS